MMKVSSFVSGSALALACWLGATFVHDVSPVQYPSQRRSGATARQTPVQAVPAAGQSQTAKSKAVAVVEPAR